MENEEKPKSMTIKQFYNYLFEPNTYSTQKALEVLERTDKLLLKVFKVATWLLLIWLFFTLFVTMGIVGLFMNPINGLFSSIGLVLAYISSMLIYKVIIFAAGALFRLVELNERALESLPRENNSADK